ncbi:hypothetical protein [Asanoa siamensis]|uniref:CU044_5270 family protein n=1 Tax=Asanoa siamensis TaxID=926357 RepID=A0ABQ4CP85_9ACTN|nr:hypothetical protein [Asanoa siamensis]GIF73090.1 hypothetical protein Asi02nite_26080 [Asanoa siamensis]
MTDPDIAAVRELPPGLPEPTDESVARTWHAMTRKQAAPAPRRRRWVPAAAALLVAGVAAGGITLLPERDLGPAIEVGVAPSPSASGVTPSRPSPSLPSKAGGGAIPTGAPASLGPSTPIDVAAAIDTLMTAVADSPAQTVQPGQFLYTRMTGVTSVHGLVDQEPGQMVRDDTELWFAPEGMTAKAITRNGVDLPPDGAPESPPEKPSIWQPTPAWLAGLPTDPTALRAELLAGMGENQKRSADSLLAKEIGELLVSSEPLLTGDVRVALLKMIKRWSGLSARETVVDDRKVWGLRRTEQGRFDEILFDPATGLAVGRASGEGGKVSYQVLWTHKLVRQVGER